MSWNDTESMAVFERREIYNRLLKRKSEEKEAMEEANKKSEQINAGRFSKSSRPSKRRR
jgi:hypothetical protein